MSNLTKRQEHHSSLEKRKFSVKEALDFFNLSPKTKFLESIDVAINLGVDTEKSDQNVRGVTPLPAGSGKPCKVAVFVDGEQAEKAKKAGADAVGVNELSKKFKDGNIDFDVVIATPETMKALSPLGKILGPKGLMPNPKTGSVTKDVVKAVKNAKAGQIRYRSDKGGIVHGRIGDISYTPEQLQSNLETLLGELKRNKPASSKGVFIKKVTLTSTMGAGVEVEISSLKF